jgi:hypothetical protein
MRSFRQLAALGILLAPLSMAWPAPAHAGGGFGLTVTASMEGQDQNLLVGTLHKVSITVSDTPGEASLRQIRVAVTDLDPTDFPVLCDAGTNGSMSLEPDQSLHCTTELRAEAGYRTIGASVVADVPGQPTSLARQVPLHYTGVMPPPPPAPRVVVMPPRPPAVHQASAGGHQAVDPPVNVPMPITPPPPGAPLAADPPATVGPPAPAGASGCDRSDAGSGSASSSGSASASGSGSASCCDPTSSGSGSKAAAGTAGSTLGHGTSQACDGVRTARAEGLSRLAHTGASAPVLAVAALAVLCGGTALVWRVRTARR